MTVSIEIDWVPFDAVNTAVSRKGGDAPGETLVIFAGEDFALSPATREAVGSVLPTLQRAAKATNFRGKRGSSLDLLAPEGIGVERVLVLGVEDAKKDPLPDAETAASKKVTLGGIAFGKLGATERATILYDLPGGGADADAAADFALGAKLRAYKFDLYRTKAGEEDKAPETVRLAIAVASPEAAKAAWSARSALADGVIVARDLVNEPPNVLHPEEFARRAEELRALGVEVDVLDEPAMTALGMGALLGVGQGSARDSRVVVMRWNGAGGGGGSGKPIAFIGKGVCFDTGGISIKPAGGMEDMKGDMAGAACVVGLMRTLAERKAKVDAIGAIGLVENMPGSNAQRPGDIVKSMSGQTIEIINTDAEGRLVLADVLHYVQDKYKPAFMIDLATLTGAIMVALGTDHAGLFSNNDELASRLVEAGRESGEKVWRLPLGTAYDKLIDSKFADMKNTGGRHGGSITAAQFLQRFVNKVPWAHLDIAGTGMGAPFTDINQSWGAGFGVRLLDRLVQDFYEGKG